MVHSPGYSLPDRWDPPSDRVRELMRQAAKIVIHTRQTFYDEVSRLSLTSNLMASVSGHSLADDPIAAEAITRSNRSNQLHWAAANISHPGEPVPANTDAETLAIARYLVRRGISEAAMVETYRLAQSISVWMKVVYRLTSDPRTCGSCSKCLKDRSPCSWARRFRCTAKCGLSVTISPARPP
ncbi:hypothetical protein MAUB_34330 [Mycolicibacterium aubagnense]|uniref:Uncharacterized protein n=2 Tax=Mycolicibacterium aubagnense TaxID=319707 RepID=A0ABM7IFN8_9MYCO|nr:hypothetical protein MAUB_34330 [Mycolicibacterium aubagnense]